MQKLKTLHEVRYFLISHAANTGNSCGPRGAYLRHTLVSSPDPSRRQNVAELRVS
jgi:hypothetical protein